jgi:hypothetical protein
MLAGFDGGGELEIVVFADAVLPSLKLTVMVKLDPEPNRLFELSEAKILKLPPSATAKFTVPFEAFSKGASSEPAAPEPQ